MINSNPYRLRQSHDRRFQQQSWVTPQACKCGERQSR